MNLATLQKRMAAAVMQPLTRSESMQGRAPDGTSMRKYAARIIKPNNRLTSFERLEIYNKQYWYRILASLQEDFPGLRAVLGSRKFEEMCKAYVCDHPSRSFTLRNLGSRMVSWLEKHPEWAGSRLRLALDMARLEWADIEAFDGQAKPALKAEEVAAQAEGNFGLQLQPYLQLLSLQYPVDDLLLEVRKQEEDSEFASNAFVERKKKKRVQATARLKTADIYLAVHRVDDTVYFRRLDREELAILSALRRGRTLAQAIATGFRGSKVPIAERANSVQGWFQHWATLGWFCSAANSTTSLKS
jgi:hypothetical protein